MSEVSITPPSQLSTRTPTWWRSAAYWLRHEQLLWRTGVCGVLVLLSLLKVNLGPVNPGLIAALLGGYPYFVTAVRGLLRLDTTVGFLVTVATLAAISIGEYYAAGHVVFIMMLGELIEDRTLRRTQQSFAALLQMFPERATVRRDGVEVVVRPEEILEGETVIVRTGERIPVDGVVNMGSAAVDQRHITGESLPLEAGPGSEVFTGSVASDGYLEVEAKLTGESTSLSRMVRLLHEAQASKAPIVKIADRFARWFSPVIIVIAGLTYFLTDDFTRTLTILVVACPCSLCVATPTAIAAGIGAGARRGLLIKSGRAVETLGRVDAVLFDKTGTLTVGELNLSKVLTVPGGSMPGEDLVKLAVAAEGASPHPIAQALRRQISGTGTVSTSTATSFRSLPGGGVSAEIEGRSVLVGPQQILQQAGTANLAEAERLWADAGIDGAVNTGIAIDGRLAAVLSFTDGPRPGLDSLMRELRATGVRHLAMVSGDRAPVAQAVAAGLGLDSVEAELRPEDKVEAVNVLRAKGYRVAVVGDGINDAPALAASDVGMAMGLGGTALTAETADVVIGGDALERLPDSIQLGRRVLRTIRQNLSLAVVVNTVAVALSAAGLIKPIGGAIIHNIGSAAVVIHSAMLLRWKPRPARVAAGTPSQTARSRAVSAAIVAFLATSLAAQLLLPASTQAHILPLVRNLNLRVGVMADYGPLTPYSLPRDGRAEMALSSLFLVYDTLTIKDSSGEVRPWVAEKLDWGDDRTLEITLAPKDKVQWHDNALPVTAEDVAATVSTYQRWPHPIFTPIAKMIARVDTEGSDRVRLILAHPDPDFPAKLAGLPLLPAHIWKKVTEPEKVRQAIGCGPFRLQSYRPEEGYRFAGVETYYLAEHRAAAVTLPFFKSASALADALYDGDLHATTVPLTGSLVERFTATLPRLRGFRVYQNDEGQYVYRTTIFSDWHWTSAGPIHRLSFLKLPQKER